MWFALMKWRTVTWFHLVLCHLDRGVTAVLGICSSSSSCSMMHTAMIAMSVAFYTGCTYYGFMFFFLPQFHRKFSGINSLWIIERKELCCKVYCNLCSHLCVTCCKSRNRHWTLTVQNYLFCSVLFTLLFLFGVPEMCKITIAIWIVTFSLIFHMFLWPSQNPVETLTFVCAILSFLNLSQTLDLLQNHKFFFYYYYYFCTIIISDWI